MNMGFNMGPWHTKPQPDHTPVARPYPMAALPRVLREAGLHVSERNLIHPALPGMTSIGVASIVVMRLAVFKMPNGRTRPASVFMTIISPPGSGKTTTADALLPVLRENDQVAHEAYELALADYETRHRAWKELRKDLRDKVVKARKDDLPWEHLQQQLTAHDKNEPPKPRNLRLLHEDITDRPFIAQLNGKGRSIALVSDEAKTVFPQMASMLGHFNKAFDGSPITLDRADESLMAYDLSFAMILMTQFETFDEFVTGPGKIAKGLGFWARHLFATLPKFEGVAYPDGGASSAALDAFFTRINELIAEYERRVREGKTDRDEIELDDDARVCFQVFANEMKARSADGGDLRDVEDFASRAAEHAGRLATVFAILNGEKKITLDTIERAITIIRYHLEEYRDRFSLISALPEAERDAETLDNYLRLLWRRGHRSVLKSHVQRNAHEDLRDLNRLDTAVDLLAAQGKIRPIHGHKKSCRIEHIPRLVSVS